MWQEGGEQVGLLVEAGRAGGERASGQGAHHGQSLSRAPSISQRSRSFSRASLSFILACFALWSHTKQQIPRSNLKEPSLEAHSLESYIGPSLIFPKGGSHKLPGMGSISHHQDFARGQSE